MQNLFNQQKIISFLVRELDKNGFYPSLTTSNKNDFSDSVGCQSVFSSALILSLLSDLDPCHQLNKIKKRLAKFLLGERSQYWTYNYWIRDSEQSKQMPYPDDWDDTSCALSALHQYDPKLLDESALASVLLSLNASESAEGGPYFSWLTNPEADKVWKDIDLAVNSNIAFFLSSLGVELENLNQFVDAAISEGNYTSPYYPSPFPVIFFISRFYSGKQKSKVFDFLRSKMLSDKTWGNPLDTSLSLLSIDNLGFEISELSDTFFFLQSQIVDDHWQAYPFYIGINPEGEQDSHYAGSEALTTAFCLSALSRFSGNSDIQIKKEQLNPEKDILIEIRQNIENHIRDLEYNFKKKVSFQINQIFKSFSITEIALLPFLFRDVLGVTTHSLEYKFLLNLSSANIFGWIAYSIYDSIFDEKKQIELLPIANYCVRQTLNIYGSFQLRRDFYKLLSETMLKIDQSQIWELENALLKDQEEFKIPNYSNYQILSEKSFGHALSVFAILYNLDLKFTETELQNLKKFFSNYLIARQLNDDAHDWMGDLKNGNINSVASLVLKKQNIKFPKEIEYAELEKVFWFDAVVDVSNLILDHLAKAKLNFSKIKYFRNDLLIQKILLPIEESAKKTIDEQSSAKKLLDSYFKL